MFYQMFLNEVKRLNSKIKSIKMQLKNAPPGTIYCSHNGAYIKWYHSLDNTRTYIPKKNRSFAQKLAVKKHLTLLLKDLLQEQTAINFYLRHHQKRPWKSDLFLTEHPEYRELVSDQFLPPSLKHQQWATSPYLHSQQHPEYLIHKTSSGILVRSKSEALISTALYNNKIPFRYECALTLNNITLFPDFTILHPVTGQIYYWEHFGLMDQHTYSNNACLKLQQYTLNGIVPGINLITTYETKDYPLCISFVEDIINYYFL